MIRGRETVTCARRARAHRRRRKAKPAPDASRTCGNGLGPAAQGAEVRCRHAPRDRNRTCGYVIFIGLAPMNRHRRPPARYDERAQTLPRLGAATREHGEENLANRARGGVRAGRGGLSGYRIVAAVGKFAPRHLARRTRPPSRQKLPNELDRVGGGPKSAVAEARAGAPRARSRCATPGAARSAVAAD